MKRDENGDYYDRDGKWSTSTCIMCCILGFAMGFIACHKVYSGFDEKTLTNPPPKQYDLQ